MKLVAGSYERFLWGWQVRAKKAQLDLAFSYPAHGGPVKCIAACGNVVATGGSDDTIKVFDVSTEKDMGSLYLHTGAVTCLDFFKPKDSPLPRPTHLFSGSDDGTVGVWDADSWAHLKSLKGHKTAVNSLGVHTTGRVALSVERDGHLKMWNLLNGRCTFTNKLPSEATLIRFSPESGESYSLVREETLDVYAVETGLVVHSFKPEKRILCLAQNQDKLIVTAGEDRAISVWDTRIGKLAIRLGDAHTNRVRGICTLNSPQSSELPHLIASASSDGSVKVWDTRRHQAVENKTPAPIFETTTRARLTCLVNCGSTKKLEAIMLASPHSDVASKKDGKDDKETPAMASGGLVEAANGKEKKKSKNIVTEMRETSSQSRKKRKKNRGTTT